MHSDHRDRLRTAFRRIYGERYDRAGLEDRLLSAAAERRLRSDRQWQPLALATAVTLVLAVALVGTLLALGQGGRQGPAPAVTPAPASPVPTQAPTPAATPPAASSAGRCHTSDLAVSLRQTNPAAGQRYAVIDLANTSSHTCWVYGYVGLLLLDGGHRAMPTTAVWTSIPHSIVDLAPGQMAYAQLHWSAVPSPDEQGGCPPAPAYVEITPPDETTQLVSPWNDFGGVCQHGWLEVQALAPGAGPS
jgi:hypothetical protein